MRDPICCVRVVHEVPRVLRVAHQPEKFMFRDVSAIWPSGEERLDAVEPFSRSSGEAPPPVLDEELQRGMPGIFWRRICDRGDTKSIPTDRHCVRLFSLHKREPSLSIRREGSCEVAHDGVVGTIANEKRDVSLEHASEELRCPRLCDVRLPEVGIGHNHPLAACGVDRSVQVN